MCIPSPLKERGLESAAYCVGELLSSDPRLTRERNQQVPPTQSLPSALCPSEPPPDPTPPLPSVLVLLLLPWRRCIQDPLGTGLALTTWSCCCIGHIHSLILCLPGSEVPAPNQTPHVSVQLEAGQHTLPDAAAGVDRPVCSTSHMRVPERVTTGAAVS